MKDQEIRARLMEVTALAARYCIALENCREDEKSEFLKTVLSLLPRIYWEFSDIKIEDVAGEAEFEYFPQYVDEDYYESIRRNVESLLGADDIFLETFEEDMKYSDTPLSASISECLADIFQPLYNFISVVKVSDGENLEGAFRECKENFEGYWSQTLCNVMRALNHLRYNQSTEI